MRLSKCSRTVRRTYTAVAASDVGGMPLLARTALWKPASVAHTGCLPEMADMRARSAAIQDGRLRWLAPFAWTGRLALTMYMLQIAVLDLAFSNSAFGLHVSPFGGLAAGLLLFATGAVLARWWMARHRFGPLEWVWRSATYGRLQPMARQPAPGPP